MTFDSSSDESSLPDHLNQPAAPMHSIPETVAPSDITIRDFNAIGAAQTPAFPPAYNGPLSMPSPWPIDFEEAEIGHDANARQQPFYARPPIYDTYNQQYSQQANYNYQQYSQQANYNYQQSYQHFSGQYPPAQPYQPLPSQMTAEVKQPGRLAKPLPLWVLLAATGGVLLLLVLLHLTGSDWATGALHAAYAALVIGIALLIFFVLRLVAGMASALNKTRLRQVMSSILVLLLLVIYSGTLQIMQPNIHSAQAHVLESQQQWQGAIDEYKLGGEKPPTGSNLARTYASWGLALNADHQYKQALTTFAVVLDQFSSVQSQVQRAHSGKIAALLALGQQEMQNKDYTDATNDFSNLLALPYCDQACSTRVNPLAATAYYDQGEVALDQHNYDASVDAFNMVLTQFASAPEAKHLHKDMAKALLGKGNTQKTASCSSALATYQQLANAYSDTAQGRTAKAALSAPQDVEGSFMNADPNVTFDQIGLATGLNGNMTQDQVFNAWGNALQTTINSDGSFVFHKVPQGDYGLLWYTSDGTTEIVDFLYHKGSNQPAYLAHVGPLCTDNVGAVSDSTTTTSNT